MQENLCIHGNFLPVLSYAFCFTIFTCVFMPFTDSSDPNAPTLVSGIFVEAGLDTKQLR